MAADDLESRVSKLKRAIDVFSGELRLALRYIHSDAASSLTKSRLVMERILLRIYTTEMGRDPRKPLLGEMLADNQFTRKIERRILTRMNAIREMGNLGPHGESVEPCDAAKVLDDLCEVLDWYLRRYTGAMTISRNDCLSPAASQPALPAPASPQGLGDEPYEGFENSFREVVAAQRIPETGAMLHLVFGNIVNIRRIPVVIPVGQAFDLLQRDPRGVLGSFESVRVEGRPFFEYLDERCPPQSRPSAAGLGHSKYLPLPQNTHDLPGVVFVVTTRDLSTASEHYGLYVETPIEGIDFVLDRVIETANSHHLTSLAIPLLGTGHANLRRTKDHAKLERLLKEAVTLLAVEKLQKNLRLESSILRRAVVVIQSQNVQGEDEHALWESVTRFLGRRTGHSAQIEELLDAINTLCASSS